MQGLIPACAGKTSPLEIVLTVPKAHPRVCGENPADGIRSFAVAGSSPRVRGKHDPACLLTRRIRLIPACAGKTHSSSLKTSPPPAHPRVCGENSQPVVRPGLSSGSSPRVRGKLNAHVSRTRAAWLIPACAGKTSTSARWTHPARAHPRVCGENSLPLSGVSLPAGSSPRVRGKQFLRSFRRPFLGLIPACAGKTAAGRGGGGGWGAHPRVCGENFESCGIDWVMAGSSPRVRGKQAGYCRVFNDFGSSPRVRGKLIQATSARRNPGLIPACAGKTEKLNSAAGTNRAHPRVCGENYS